MGTTRRFAHWCGSAPTPSCGWTCRGAVVLRRIVGRTFARTILRTTLWNGNRERWRNLTTLDPEQSAIAWSWTHHATYRERYGGAVEDPAWAHCRFVRLRSAREVDAFLAGVGAARRT
jgi:hypothetical protein